MSTNTQRAVPSALQIFSTLPHIAPARLVEYFGVVNYATNERVLGRLRALSETPSPMGLVVTSAGGPSGTAMSFYDSVRSVLQMHLTSIGAGDVDSSGLIVFLSGTRRFVTPHTTALLHPAGRSFEGGARYTARELEAMLAEDKLKDAQYAGLLAHNSSGLLTLDEVLKLMEAHTVLEPKDFVRLGLAEAIIQ